MNKIKQPCLISIVLPLCLSFTPPAMAQEWETIVNDHAKKIAVDTDSYDEQAGMPSLTVRVTYSTVQKIDNITYDRMVFHPKVNCQQAHMQQGEISYFLKKKPVYHLSKPEQMQFTPIQSNSINAPIGQLTCQVKRMVSG